MRILDHTYGGVCLSGVDCSVIVLGASIMRNDMARMSYYPFGPLTEHGRPGLVSGADIW